MFIEADYLVIFPEIWISVLLIIFLFWPGRSSEITPFKIKSQYRLARLALSFGLLVNIGFLLILCRYPTQVAWSGLYRQDAVSVFLKLWFNFIFLGAVQYSYYYYFIRKSSVSSDLISLWLGLLLGAMILVSANHVLILFLGLELFSLSSYALMACFQNRFSASEAAIKYFILSSVVSGIFLYGWSLLYGLTGGGLMFSEIAHTLAQSRDLFEHAFLLYFAMGCLLVGVGFKLGWVPFHAWVPDVYQGSPIGFVILLSSLSKLVGVGLAYRVLWSNFGLLWGSSVGGFIQSAVLSFIVLTVLVGNVVALLQTDVRRLLGYSAIAQVAWVGAGIWTGTNLGWQSAVLYSITDSLVILLIFGVMNYLIVHENGLELSHQLKGLRYTKPGLAICLLIGFLSLVGIPPLIGFYGKWAVIRALFEVQAYGLALGLGVWSVIGACYYLRVIKWMYFEHPVSHDIESLSMGSTMYRLLCLHAMGLVGLGLFPAVWINWIPRFV